MEPIIIYETICPDCQVSLLFVNEIEGHLLEYYCPECKNTYHLEVER